VASPHTIAKLKDILLILDIPENAKSQVKQQFGTNFLVYKVKYLNPQDLLAHLKQIVKEAPNQDSLIKSVSGAQFSPSSNSIVFTGDKVDLDKIQTLLENLDIGQEIPVVVTPTRQAESYKIYKPTHVPGGELIKMVQNFEQHLVASGVTNADLAEVIDHLSYVDRTNTLILTGKEADINQVITLLKEFDNQETASGKGGKMFESGVETIDDTGFLIYKLQHQSGSGIVQALTVISSDLSTQTSQKKNTSLVEAIRSTQWVEPTNSLIATGQPRVLTKLRELIESIDQPLKQVFIEILVVESNNTDDLEFGLSWGSQGAVHNRFSWGGGNWSTNDVNTSGATSGTFPSGLQGITGSTLPTGQDIPPLLGGFFGVIGDIIWHKGKSYASLGSLVKAFRNTGTVTEVLSQKIVAQDNQNAKIFSGSNIPFTGSLVTTSGLSQTTNANLEYRNVGVTLSITPIIGDNDIITMDIDYELSEEANQGTGGISSSNSQGNSVNGITTTKTSMQTKVHLPDRHFLVLSGTMQNSSTRVNNGIPCLGGLPLVGAAFSLNTKLTTTQNVLIFVKPHIIKSEQIYGKITKEQEEIFGNRNQTNVEDFQNGLELIRSADDIDYEENE
jgi:type II secretory pathway component GspD/PulD (secretin)